MICLHFNMKFCSRNFELNSILLTVRMIKNNKLISVKYIRIILLQQIVLNSPKIVIFLNSKFFEPKICL